MLTRLTICSLCILTICNFIYFRFGFEGWIWVLISSVHDLCILFTFNVYPKFGQILSINSQDIEQKQNSNISKGSSICNQVAHYGNISVFTR